MACLVSGPWLFVGGLVGLEDDLPAFSCAGNGDLREYEKKNGVVTLLPSLRPLQIRSFPYPF
jgi:hypothetical protein